MTTILISPEQVGPLRASLLAQREQHGEDVAAAGPFAATAAERLAGIEAVLAELPPASPGGNDVPVPVSGPPDVLFSALYDVVGQAAEQVQEECLEYWRGTPPEAVRAAIARLAAWFELLAGLGPPPAGR